MIEAALADIDELAALPGNPKLHSIPDINGSMHQFGFLERIVINRVTGHIISGHGRTDTLRADRDAGKSPPENIEVRDGHWFAPVDYVDVPANKEAAAALALNRTVELAGYDEALLGETMRMIRETPEVPIIGWDDASVEQLIQVAAHTRAAPLANVEHLDDVPDAPERPFVRTGDLWALGDHRLLCGDCTKPEDVARVMGTDKALLMNTDPPYGIAYTDETRVMAERAHGRPSREQKWEGGIENDDRITGADLQQFLESVIRVAVPHLVENAAFYLWHPMLTQGTFFAAAAADILIHRQIIWVKPSLLFGFGDYHWRHELAFYGWRRTFRPPFYGPRNQTTVWDITHDASNAERVHPTQKPVELFVRPIENHTKIGEVVYEPFAGSGSQIIAAEKTGRRCRAIEIEPKYCQVVLSRWERATGKTATLDGKPSPKVESARK